MYWYITALCRCVALRLKKYVCLLQKHMHALTIFPVVYTLELEDNFYYVGATHNLNQRLSQHITGIGAKFLRQHAFKRVRAIQVVQDGQDALEVENATTKALMDEVGSEFVRGGKWCRC